MKYKDYRMKSLKCLMTDIPKISKEFKARIDRHSQEVVIDISGSFTLNAPKV